jgi:3-oxoacyl-ACP reductase-like protein
MNLLTEPELFRGYDPKKNGSLYVDWVDSKTGEPVDDKDVKSRYEKEILSHAGVRLIGKLRLDLY